MKRPVTPLVLLVLFQILLCLPVVGLELAGRIKPVPSIGACRSDAFQYHIPQVHYFIAHPFDFKPYDTKVAMGPGYHATLATLCRLTGQTDERGVLVLLHTVQFLLGFAYLYVLWRYANSGDNPHPWQSFIVLLPAVLTPYNLNENNWPVTIMPSNLLVFVALLIYERLNRDAVPQGQRPLALIGAGLLIAGALAIRQNVIWALAPLAYLGLRALQTRVWRVPEWLAAVLSVVFPAGVLGALYLMWGGLVPPGFQKTHTSAGFSLPSILYAVSLIGCVFPFYLGYFWNDLREMGKNRLVQLAGVGAALGLFLAVIGPTTLSYQTGRNGGLLWGLAGKLPAVGERSVLWLVLGPLGGVALTLLVSLAWRRGLEIFSVAFLAWLVVCGLNTTAYHRYFEAMILLYLSFVAARTARATRYALAGPVFLAIAFVGLYLLQFRGGGG